MSDHGPPMEDPASLPALIRLSVRLSYPKRAEAEGWEDCLVRQYNETLASKGQEAARKRLYKEAFYAVAPGLFRTARKILTIWFIT